MLGESVILINLKGGWRNLPFSFLFIISSRFLTALSLSLSLSLYIYIYNPITYIKFNPFFSLFVSPFYIGSGELYTWGSNENGCLGIGFFST